MKLHRILCSVALSALTLTAFSGEKLVIVATNDTHSQIDPDDKGNGGILRRKVLLDSIRQRNDNVLLIDAGDAVQGTLYFNLYKGEVEHKMMNFLDYDIAI
ncbi:MAG: bifunctional metallophosphatase/5'-nucleotidase, partial [Muribaculaceae bacterium]|nr:bifunctional metallophosphatase/5'-nucleotidase [Muribaculaceae bacterium]